MKNLCLKTVSTYNNGVPDTRKTILLNNHITFFYFLEIINNCYIKLDYLRLCST